MTEPTYKEIMMEVRNMLLEEAAEIKLKASVQTRRINPIEAAQLLKPAAILEAQAELILFMLDSDVPPFLQEKYLKSRRKLSHLIDPEWVEYQRLKSKFNNA